MNCTVAGCALPSVHQALVAVLPGGHPLWARRCQHHLEAQQRGEHGLAEPWGQEGRIA